MKHSPIGPSAAACWMNCPGSVNASKQYPHESNIYAAQGTAAHQIAEICLNEGHDASFFKGEIINVDNMEFEVDQEMVVGVQMYLDVIRSDMESMAKERNGNSTVMSVEEQVRLTKVHPDLWGTLDCLIVNIVSLKVYDLKYGRTVVEARGNPQTLCYAIGALLGHDKKKTVEEIEMIIVQPRVPQPVKRWMVTRGYLNEYAKTLRAAALATESENAPRIPGEVQCQWCRHKPHCPELEQFALDKAGLEFDSDGEVWHPDIDTLSDNRFTEILRWSSFVTKYLKSVESEALKRLQRGDTVQGFKLVEKRPTRHWDFDQSILDSLKELGLEDDDLFNEQTLKSPAQIDKLLTQELREEAKTLQVSVSSGTKIVPEDDPAPAVGAGPVSDFADD